MARMHGKVVVVTAAAWGRLQAGFGRGQRMAQPEVASLVTYLASDDTVDLNGAVIPADGGWTAA